MKNSVRWLETSLVAAADHVSLGDRFKPRGVVRRVGDGVVFVSGLEEVRLEEMLTFDSGAFGMAYDLRADGIGVILLAESKRVHEGDGVVGLGFLPDLPVGPETLGRILDPLGNPLDEGPPLSSKVRLPLFRPRQRFVNAAMLTRRCGPASWRSTR